MEKKARTRVLAADGLRGLAMVAIVLFHLRPTPLPGGFLGVSVFFVLSGFFITTGIDRRLETGDFHYGRYELHRLTRLWPPVMASIALAVLLSLVFAPEYLPKMARDGWASAALLSNWWLIVAKIPYFAAAGLPSPLKPLWFVALIMQFYLVWALLLWLLRTVFSSDRAVLAVTLALMAASAAEMAVLYDPADSGRVYYGLDTRFAELLAGAALAMVWEMTGGAGRWRVSTRTVRDASGKVTSVPGELVREEWVRPQTRMWMDAAGWVALVALVFGCFFVDGWMDWLYRGGYLLAALLACAVLASCLAGGSLATVLSWKPLRHLGAIAFSLYLVHFPIFEVMDPASRLEPPTGRQMAGQVLVVWLAAELFHELVEKGSSQKAVAWRRNLTRAVAIVGAVCVVVLTVVPAQGWEGYAHSRRMDAISAALRQEKAENGHGAQAGEGAGPSTGSGRQDRSGTGNGQTGRNSGTGMDNAGAGAHGAKGPAPATTQPPVPRVDITKKRVPAAPVSRIARGGGLPDAAKVPANLNAGRWSWNAADGTSDAKILILGDSVVLGAKADIEEVFPHAVEDAQVGRQFGTAVDLFRQHAAKGEKGDVLVVALGANGPITDAAQIQKVIDAAGGMPVFFVTVRGPMTWTDANNALIRQVVAKNRNAGLLDWNAVSAGHPEYFYDDGTHLTPGPQGGRQAWMRMLRRALCGV